MIKKLKKILKRRGLGKKVKRFKPAMIAAGVLAFVVAGTTIVSLFIRGYRPDIKKGGLFPTGLLAAISLPKGALVYVDDKLVTATDDTITLSPGEYQLKLIKDGYLPWEKKALVKKEVVFQTDAHLFRSAPDLTTLTNTGAINPALSPDGAKIAYAVASSSAEIKNGLWVSRIDQGGLNLFRSNTHQLVAPVSFLDWSKAVLIWSPDSAEVLAIFGPLESPSSVYRLPADRLTPADQLRNEVLQLSFTLSGWQTQKQEQLTRDLEKLPKELAQIASESAQLVTFSPHQKKIFYLASREASLPEKLLPHPPARSTEIEERNIKSGGIYVYDLEQDTNFFIIGAEKIGLDPEKITNQENLLESYLAQTQTSLYWLSTNNHLVFLEDNQAKVVEADATNKQTVFAGPFENGYVFPSPDGNKLIILTSLHPSLPANLYGVTIR
ncbi:PEGA domain-containing protein [Candidatus Shapirobacteria bacterium]|nr:PEGA domain-containing protein [Candidatus Shapirobacteria bacterium]